MIPEVPRYQGSRRDRRGESSASYVSRARPSPPELDTARRDRDLHFVDVPWIMGHPFTRKHSLGCPSPQGPVGLPANQQKRSQLLLRRCRPSLAVCENIQFAGASRNQIRFRFCRTVPPPSRNAIKQKVPLCRFWPQFPGTDINSELPTNKGSGAWRPSNEGDEPSRAATLLVAE
jgi:hypothetical protein